MELNNLALPTTTTMRLIGQDGRETDVYITGHTPDSKEWRQAQREYAPKGQENLSMRVRKKGENTVDLPTDPNAHENWVRRLAAVVTDIQGLTINGQPWVYSPEAVFELFSNDGCAWIVEQWEDHMDDRRNFLKPAGTTANSGSNVSAGSTVTRTGTGQNSPDLDLTSNG